MSLTSALKRLINQKGNQNTSPFFTGRTAVKAAAHSVVESLESRQLLTAVTYPTIGVLGVNAASIPYQDTTMITADGTNFGSIDTKKNLVETFTIKNTGAGILNLTAFNHVQITGANAADFTVISQPVGTVVPGGSTTFKLKFAPTIAGVETATVSINNDTDSEDPFTYNIEGTGTQYSKAGVFGNSKAIAAGDTTISTTDNTSFGSVESASGSVSKTFTITNTGSGTLHLSGGLPAALSGSDAAAFSVTTQPPATIAAGASATFVVKFQPGTTGTKNATITLTTDDTTAASYHFNIQGTAVNAPVMAVEGTGAALITDGSTSTSTTLGTDFGTADLYSSSATKTFTIVNSGANALTLSGNPVVAISGVGKTAYTVVGQPSGTLAAGASTSFQILFAPGSVGTKAATVTINSNDANHLHYNFALTGVGVSQPLISLKGGTVPTALTPGQTTTGSSDGTDFGTADTAAGGPTHNFTVYNGGSGALNLIGAKVTISGANAADFSVATAPAAIVPGVTVTRVAAGRPVSTPKKTKTKSSARYGGASVSKKKSSSTVSSNGPIVHSGILPSTSFAIAFTPGSVGAKTAVVTVTTNDPTNPAYSFTIGGTAVSVSDLVVTGANNATIANGDVTPLLTDGTNFGAMDETQTATDTFTLKNIGSQTLNLSGTPAAVISGANAADFTVTTDAPATIASGASANVVVTFQPTTMGVESAQLTLTSDDPNSPYVFNLQGTGQAIAVAQVQGNSNTIAPGAATSIANTTNFGTAELSQGFVNETYTINNTGTGTMNLTGALIHIDGTGKNDFTVTTPPASSIAAGASTTFVVRFKPTTSVGVRNATVSVLSNDPVNPTYTFPVVGTSVRQSVIQLSGLGVAIANNAVAGLTTNGTDFGTNDVGGSLTHTFSIKNNGTDSLDLSGSPTVMITGANAADFTLVQHSRTSLAAGATGTFTIKFTPTVAGSEAATVTINSNDPVTPAYTFTLAGTGAITSVISIKGGTGGATLVPTGEAVARSVDGTDYGQAIITTGSVSESYTIANTGGAALNLTGTPLVSLSGANAGDFTVTSMPSNSINATTGTSTFIVSFNPTAAGTRTATVTVASDDPSTPSYTFTVKGVGITAPVMQVQEAGTTVVDGETTPTSSDGTDFGSVELTNGFATETFTINNTGSAALNLSGTPIVHVTGANAADFTVLTQPTATVTAGGSTTFQVKFKPSAVGSRNASVSITSNDNTTSPYTFNLTGTAVVQPVLTVMGNNIAVVNGENAKTTDGTNFGSAKANSATVTKTFTVKNTGSAPLSLNGSPLIEIDGPDSADFVVGTQPSSSPLAIGATTTFTITFTPTSVAAENASVTIASTDPNGAFSFNLGGTGTV